MARISTAVAAVSALVLLSGTAACSQGAVDQAVSSESSGLGASPTSSYPGTLDPAFNNGSYLKSMNGFFWSGGLLSDGTIIGAGSMADTVASALAFTSTGATATSWGKQGVSQPSEGAGFTAAAVGPGNNLYGLVPFNQTVVPIQINSQGEQTALGTGIPGTIGRQVLPLANGSILVTVRNLTSNQFQIARYTSNLKLDTTFGCAAGKNCKGYTTGPAGWSESVALQGNRIVVAGTVPNGQSAATLQIARYLPNGTLDKSFGCGKKGTCSGALSLPQIQGLNQQAPSLGMTVAKNGSILVDVASLQFQDDSPVPTLHVVQVNPNGTSSSEFATVDSLMPEQAQSIVIDHSGRVVVGGTDTNSSGGHAVLARWTADGQLDRTFGCANGQCSGVVNQVPGAVQTLLVANDGNYVTLGTDGTGYATVAKYLS